MAGQAYGYDDTIEYLAIQDNKRILISEKKMYRFFTVIHGEHMLNSPTRSLSEERNPNHLINNLTNKYVIK